MADRDRCCLSRSVQTFTCDLPSWEITAYEAKILYCLAATLLDINVDMLRKHGMSIPQSVRSAYEANTAENLRELMQLMTERLMG